MKWEYGKKLKDIILLQNESNTNKYYKEYVWYKSNVPSELKKIVFVQENEVYSHKNVLRGMGYQKKYPQGKFLHVLNGAIYDVAVDMRLHSSTYGKWEGYTLSAQSKISLWIPPGFAHGYLVLEDDTKLVYKCTEYYHPEDEYGFRFDDEKLGITWPVKDWRSIICSDKDLQLGSFVDCSGCDMLKG